MYKNVWCKNWLANFGWTTSIFVIVVTLLNDCSPSDLDADLEDNQDYDSTVSQSETNLTMIGQSQPTGIQHFQMDAPPEVGWLVSYLPALINHVSMYPLYVYGLRNKMSS